MMLHIFVLNRAYVNKFFRKPFEQIMNSNVNGTFFFNLNTAKTIFKILSHQNIITCILHLSKLVNLLINDLMLMYINAIVIIIYVVKI